jgi:uncharacterized protein (DUF1800 family)
MLRLLDGDLNVKGSPNENYARELLELYSIGRGLEGSLPHRLPFRAIIFYIQKKTCRLRPVYCQAGKWTMTSTTRDA